MRTINSATKIFAIQVENLGWISAGNLEVRNIKINGIDVSENPTMFPTEDLSLDVRTDFAINIVNGTYNIVTTINTQ